MLSNECEWNESIENLWESNLHKCIVRNFFTVQSWEYCANKEFKLKTTCLEGVGKAVEGKVVVVVADFATFLF